MLDKNMLACDIQEGVILVDNDALPVFIVYSKREKKVSFIYYYYFLSIL